MLETLPVRVGLHINVTQWKALTRLDEKKPVRNERRSHAAHSFLATLANLEDLGEVIDLLAATFFV